MSPGPEQQNTKKDGSWVFDADRLVAIARSAAQRVSEGRGQRDDAIIALVFSAMALEGWVNELAEWAAVDRHADAQCEAIASALGRIETARGSIHEKLRVLAAASGRPVSRGRQPYQDFDLLFRIRHALVHLKPEFYDKGVRDDHPLVLELVQRGIIDVERDPLFGSWLDQISKASVAEWAYRTCTSMLQEVVEVLPEGRFRRNMAHHAEWMLHVNRYAPGA